MSENKLIRVVFVCMGNICRSPTAQGVFESRAETSGLTNALEIDSAGTHAYHIGNPPDRRSQEAAAKRGIDLASQRARRIEHSDFAYFDYILAMDSDNLSNMQSICPQEHQHKLQLFLDLATQYDEREVPDPYYGGGRGFDRVLDLIEDATEGLIEKVKADLKTS